MSSSLDDLEPYEVFQQELDEYLKNYRMSLRSEKSECSKKILIVNHYIEYVCFKETYSTIAQINNEEVFRTFHSNHTFLSSHFTASEILSVLKEFIDFILTGKHKSL